MDRYCTCNRGIGYSNRTSLVHNSIMGKDICSHCGGIVPPKAYRDYNPYMYPNGPEDENNAQYTDYYELAKECSIKGDHASAIKFYKERLRQSGHNPDCEVMSAIADEYETIGDYASAEEYWMRCSEVERHDSYKYIAGKGDFLYRRERYGEAIGAYEEALKDMDDGKMNLAMLKCYARTVHFIINSYMRLGENNPKEKYHEELKHAINRYIKAKSFDDDETKAYYMSQTAWEIYESGRMSDEALILIDCAIKVHPTANDYERKAIFIKSKLKIEVLFNRIKPHHLDLINEALKILPDDCDNGPYLNVKGDILDQLGDPVKARICRALAYKSYDEVNEVEKQLKKLKSAGTYINITGVHYYQGFTPFKEGTVVDLIKEPDNQHDPFAIRVEVNGETVGYVANNRYTLIKEVKSATDIKDSNATQAKVQFILFREWVIAKLI